MSLTRTTQVRRTLFMMMISMLIMPSFEIASAASENASENADETVAAYWWRVTPEGATDSNQSTQQTAALVLDIDLDGANDLVIGTRRPPGPALVWYHRHATGWQRFLIDAEALDIEAGGAYHDIDSDGDLDIVMGGDGISNQVWWWENPYPHFVPDRGWTRRLIKDGGANKHHDQLWGDFDNDGQAELVFWNQQGKTLYLAEVPTNPHSTQPWPLIPIYTWSRGPQHEGLAVADIDGDDQLDIVGAGRWFKHLGGTAYQMSVIDPAMAFTRVAAGQLIPGGRPEVVFVVGDGNGPIRWYQWDGADWIAHDLLDEEIDHGHSLQILDHNNDGFLDIFVAEMRLDGGNPDAKARVFLGNGNGHFIETALHGGYGNHESKLADLDGDGDYDLLGKPYNWETPRLDVWFNGRTCGRTLDSWVRHVIDDARPDRALFIDAADLTGDGLAEIVTGGWWYRNPGIAKSGWERNVIGAPLNNMAVLYDFDNDGDVDILGTQGSGSAANANFVWARNDGSGNFTILDNIEAGDGDFLQGVVVDRFLPGGPPTVMLSWHAAGKGIQALVVPDDPSTQPWRWARISTESQDEQLSSDDIDGDGDKDLLLGTKWLRNDGSTWSIQTLHRTDELPDRNRLADINGDGRPDSIVGYESTGSTSKPLAWYAQPGTATDRWSQHIIAEPIAPMSVDVRDMDGDGDSDLIAGEHNQRSASSARMLIYENVDGAGQNWREIVVHTGDEHHDGARVFDIDRDGDLDILSIGWTHDNVVLYENRSPGCERLTGPPSVVAQPQNVTGLSGHSVTVRIVADGARPLAYGWQKDGASVPGANQPVLWLDNLRSNDNGSTLNCTVSNAWGTANCEDAVLQVHDVSEQVYLPQMNRP